MPNAWQKTDQILELRATTQESGFEIALRPTRFLRSVESEKVKKGDVIV